LAFSAVGLDPPPGHILDALRNHGLGGFLERCNADCFKTSTHCRHRLNDYTNNLFQLILVHQM
jgi:hypothetical protein